MKEEWLFHGAVVPIDVETTAALVAEIKRLIDVIGGMALAQPEKEPLEYWNAVEGWVKIDEVREHFDSVGCGTIYKTAGEDRVPLYTTPPQRTERPVDCERCNRLEEHAYDLVAKLRVANIKLSMQSQRTWVGMTDEEIKAFDTWHDNKDKLRSKNNG